MRKHILGIDHVVILARDLEHARQTYARLGFTLTPRGYHTLGSQNHCIMFERDAVLHRFPHARRRAGGGRARLR
jgi:catechol 2,3-dioxygenase-like lactoylglutathione lyase family enzyme